MPTSPTKIPASPFTPAQSFGPKRIEKKSQGGLVQNSVTALFFLSLVVSAALFGYRFTLQQKLTAVQTELSAEKLKTSPEDYELVRAHDRVLRAAQYLLTQRTLHTKIFTELESVTKTSVFYSSFESILNESGDIALTLGGVSPEVAQVVLQHDALNSAVVLEKTRLSRIEKRSSESGSDSVGFVMQISVPKGLILWTAEDAATAAVPIGGATTDSPDIVPNSAE